MPSPSSEAASRARHVTCSGRAPTTSYAAAYWAGTRDSLRWGVASTAFPSLYWSDSVVSCLRTMGSGRVGGSPWSWSDGRGSAGEGPSGVSGCRNGCLYNNIE